MQDARPSRTAMRVAIRRAAHQLFDQPPVFADPIAVAIIGSGATDAMRADPGSGRSRFARSLRAFLAARGRVAEDGLAQAVVRGVSQFVVLGAGLDTFAYRNPYPALRVFEVDFPATQAWKRRKLAEAAIPIPSSVTFAPVDFERQTLADGLMNAGFDPHLPTWFSWLGVTMYLTEAAIDSTLAFVGSTPRGGGLVFDYAVPRSSLSLVERLVFDAIARKVQSVGEPFQTFFEPGPLALRMTRAGFGTLEDLGRDELNARYFANRTDKLRVTGGLARVMRAEI